MFRMAAIGVFLLACLLDGETAEAQFWRIGPGGSVSVRAPFVRVEVAPNGATSVRAPFVRVYSPGYAQNQYLYSADEDFGTTDDVESIPPGQIIAPESMPLADLRTLLIDRWHGLHQDLGLYSTGAGWQEYLSIPESMLSDTQEVPIPLPDLQEALEKFDFVAEAEEYVIIAELASFQETRHLLKVFIDRQSGEAADSSPFQELPLPQPLIPEP